MQRQHDLDRLPSPPLTAGEKLLQCLQMYEEGLELQAANFRRRFPQLSEAELATMMQSWLERRDEP